jgi:hypothetical protein
MYFDVLFKIVCLLSKSADYLFAGDGWVGLANVLFATTKQVDNGSFVHCAGVVAVSCFRRLLFRE